MIAGRLTVTTLRTQIARAKDQVYRQSDSARRCSEHFIALRRSRVQHSAQMLAALSYKGELSRGFALVRDEAGLPLHHAAQVGAGERISIEFADGRIAATALGAQSPEKNAAKPAKPAAA